MEAELNPAPPLVLRVGLHQEAVTTTTRCCKLWIQMETKICQLWEKGGCWGLSGLGLSEVEGISVASSKKLHASYHSTGAQPLSRLLGPKKNEHKEFCSFGRMEPVGERRSFYVKCISWRWLQ